MSTEHIPIGRCTLFASNWQLCCPCLLLRPVYRFGVQSVSMGTARSNYSHDICFANGGAVIRWRYKCNRYWHYMVQMYVIHATDTAKCARYIIALLQIAFYRCCHLVWNKPHWVSNRRILVYCLGTWLLPLTWPVADLLTQKYVEPFWCG